MELSLELSKRNFNGLAFINLVDFDMIYGHRNDVDGYAKALAEFDTWLPKLINNLRENDTLIITADHGCDPSDISTDHTREYVPLIIYGKNIKPRNCGTLKSLSCISSTIAEIFGIPYHAAGSSLL